MGRSAQHMKHENALKFRPKFRPILRPILRPEFRPVMKICRRNFALGNVRRKLWQNLVTTAKRNDSKVTSQNSTIAAQGA